MKRSYFVTGLLLALGPFAAGAAETTGCTEYRAEYSGGGGPRYGSYISGSSQADVGLEACQSLASAMVGINLFVGGASRTLLSISDVTYSTAGGGSCNGTRNFTGSYTAGGFGTNGFGSRNVNTAICPVDPCEEFEGVATSLSGLGPRPATACHGVGGQMCQFKQIAVSVDVPGESSSHWVARMTPTGESCSASDDLSSMGDCIVMASGKYACAGEPSQPGCGILNGKKVCLDAIPEGTCALNVDGEGGFMCFSDAGSPPIPDDGTPGSPAVPDALFAVPDGEGGEVVAGYYGGATVTASSTGGAGVVGSSPDAINGEPDGDDGASYGDGPDGESWDAAGGMSGVIAAVGSHGWIGVLVGSAAALSGSSTCPSVVMDVDFMDTSFDLFDAACGYMEPHYGLWTMIMQIAWGLLALRVFWMGGKS